MNTSKLVFEFVENVLSLAQAFYVAQDLENAIEYYEKSAELDVDVVVSYFVHL